MRNHRSRARPLALTLGIAASPALVAWVFFATGGLYVETRSIEPYLVRWKSSVPAVGDYARVCPPTNAGIVFPRSASAACAHVEKPLMKPVVAVGGDTVELADDAVTVNGRRIPFSHTVQTTSSGQTLTPYPRGTYVLKEGEIWVLSTHVERSFDSRYFGPVPAHLTFGAYRPFL